MLRKCESIQEAEDFINECGWTELDRTEKAATQISVFLNFRRLKMHLMKYDPATGEEKPYPSEASQYRMYHGAIAWLYNPYTGGKRDPRDIGSDVLGHLVEPK